MPKDSQPDPKKVQKAKSRGGPTLSDEANKNKSRNAKKQSASRHKPGDDK